MAARPLTVSVLSSFDNLVGTGEQRLRNRQPDRLAGLEIVGPTKMLIGRGDPLGAARVEES